MLQLLRELHARCLHARAKAAVAWQRGNAVARWHLRGAAHTPTHPPHRSSCSLLSRLLLLMFISPNLCCCSLFMFR
jgi:hypothetical protein